MLLSIGLSWWLGAAPSVAAGTNISLSPASQSIVADGRTTTVQANVTDTSIPPLVLPVLGDSVTFSSNGGQTFSTDGGQTFTTTASGSTDVSGNVTAIVRTTTTLGQSTITATDTTPTPNISAPATLNQIAPPPPMNTGLPTISGAAQQGAVLNETNGTWQPNATSFSYQWEHCPSIGNGSCTGITGATSQGYTLGAGDVGFKIRVVETASDGNPRTGTANSARTATVIPLAPTPIALPTISGSPAPGQTLTEASGGWNNNPTSFSYQWQDCDSSGAGCVPSLFGANQPTYVVNALDLGKTIRVVETARNGGGSGSAPSPQTGVVVQFSSTTSLSTAPTTSVTNGGVKLTATVTSSVGAVAPSGTITFYNGSRAITGCTNDPVAGSTQNVTVTCQTSFAASTSPEALSAAFTASAGTSVAGSQSTPLRLAVGKDSTSTALDVSNLTVKTGSSTTYTATVSPGHAGSFGPTGSVEFLDGAKPISSCLKQGLGGSPAASATCTVRYKKKGTHRITAIYGGDANFGGAPVSPVLKVSVRKLRTGAVTSTMQWTFFYTPAYTRVLTLVVNGPPFGGTVLVECHGKGCPFVKRTTPVATFKSCIGKGPKLHCSVRKPKTVNLMRGFRKHHLHVGARITVELLRPNFIGKNYVFKVRSGSAPKIQIRCLAPGAKRPGVGC